MARFDPLPPGVLPFLVGRDSAAALLGISPVTFDGWIAAGLMPDAVSVRGRVLWDTEELRAAAKRLPRRGVMSDPDGEWMGA